MFNQNCCSGCQNKKMDPICCPQVNSCMVNNQVIYQDVLHPVNQHYHTVNTVVRRHYVVPSCSNSEEIQYVDEYIPR